jgi:hypothetical protein
MRQRDQFSWENHQLNNQVQELQNKVKRLSNQVQCESFDLIGEVLKAQQRYKVEIATIEQIYIDPEEKVVFVDVIGVGGYLASGVAKCGPKDQFNPTRGIKIALYRAAKKLQQCP